MKFDHKVKYNGKWYMPEENIEVEKSASIFVSYTKTDINRMSIAELKAFAKEQGIDAAEKMTGADLKKILIERLGL